MRRTVLESLAVALESAPAGKLEREIEFVFFAKIDNLDWTKNAAETELQEQWEIRLPGRRDPNGSGIVRTRAVNNNEYSIGMKYRTKGSEGSLEVEQTITKEMFDVYKLFATSGFIKRRHKFPVPGSKLVWEVDLYYDRHGKPVDWVKMDLEVPSMAVKRPAYPIPFVQIIENQYDQRTKQEHDLVNKVFDSFKL